MCSSHKQSCLAKAISLQKKEVRDPAKSQARLPVGKDTDVTQALFTPSFTPLTYTSIES